MKKLVKIILIVFAVLIGLSIMGAALGGSKNKTVKEAFEEGKQKGREVLVSPTLTKEQEKEIYDAVTTLFKKYNGEAFAKYETPTSEQLDEGEQRALIETAQKYNITAQQVKEVFEKLDKEKYNR